MTLETLPYFFFLFLAPLISIGVGLYAWKQHATPGHRTFAMMMFAISWWGFFYAIQLLAGQNLELQIFWNSIRQIGASIVSPHFLLFVLHYTSNEKRITRGLYFFLGIPVVLSNLLSLTNNIHQLYWYNMALTQSGLLTVLQFDRGFANLLYIGFSYLQILAAIIFLFGWLYSNSQRLYRLQVVVFVLSVLAPWSAHFVFSLGLIKLDPTPFAFMLTGIGFAWAIFRFRLLDLAPVARDLIIENHEDAVFVLNLQSQIIDLNQTARTWLQNSSQTEVIGQYANQVFATWPAILITLGRTDKSQQEFSTGTGENARTFEIRVTGLAGTNNRQIGRLLLLRDITSRRQLDQTLREAQLKYQSLAEHIPAATYMDNPDELGTANYMSPQIETMLGYPLTEWERDPQFWHKVVYPEDYAEASKIIQKTLKEGRAAAEYRMVAQDGHVVWVQDESILIRDEAGRPLWVQGIMIDITERKHAEQSLKELQLRYQYLAERIPATIYIDTLDESGVNDYMSPKIETILGYPPEAWKEDPHFWHKLIYPEDYSTAVSSIQNTLEKGGSNVEYRMVDKNGQQVWIQDESVLIRNEQGNPLWIQGVLLDITRRKKAEAVQQAFLDDMKALQEIHLNLSVIEDLDNLYIQMVSQAQTRLGFDRLGLFALDHTQNQLKGTFGVGIGGEIRDERYYQESITEDHWTLEIFNAPRRTKLWENAPLFDDAKIIGYGWKAATTLWNGRQAVGYMVCDNYVSRKPARPYETELLSILGSIYGHLIERKQTEALLQASEARFRQIIENASDIIYRTDANGNFVYANPTALRTVGFSAEQEILGRNFLEICVPEQREQLRQMYSEQFASKTLNTYYEFAALTPDKRAVWLGQNVQLILENNQVTGFQAVARDITLRKEAEAKAAERATQLSALNQLGRDIVASLDIPHVCAATHKAIETLMPMEAFYIALYHEENQEIEDVYLYDDNQIWPNSRGPLAAHGMAGKVIQSGRPLLIEDDFTPDVPLEDKILFGAPRDTRSVMVVPLVAEGKIIGAISAQHYEPNVYTPAHLELLELLGNQVAIALKNAQQVQALQLQAAMLDAAANAIAIIDLTGIIQWINPAFTQLTGYTSEE
ncbi:MAG TPA: PAS domain S-box protein, partial [Anaerolineales bacterium]|nr:PAS domain S-box protein [Anaerolineales bacterium]